MFFEKFEQTAKNLLVFKGLKGGETVFGTDFFHPPLVDLTVLKKLSAWGDMS